MMLVSIIGLSGTPPENNIRNDRDRLIQDCGYKANKKVQPQCTDLTRNV